jgi:hypothetical protein
MDMNSIKRMEDEDMLRVHKDLLLAKRWYERGHELLKNSLFYSESEYSFRRDGVEGYYLFKKRKDEVSDLLGWFEVVRKERSLEPVQLESGIDEEIDLYLQKQFPLRNQSQKLPDKDDYLAHIKSAERTFKELYGAL